MKGVPLMKHSFFRFLAFLMMLCIPFSAMAEPLRWLDPWIDLAQEQDGTRSGKISFSISTDGLMPIMEASYATVLTDMKFEGMTEEETDAYLASANAMLHSQMNAARTNLAAFSALSDALSIEYTLSGSTAQFTVFLGQDAAGTFALIKDAEGETYLVSDLAPSYALKLNQKAAQRMLSVTDLLYFLPILPYQQSEGSEDQADALGDLISLLPALADLNLLSASIERSRRELETLAENGLADCEGNNIFYTGDYAACVSALEELMIPSPAPYDDLIRLMHILSADAEEEDEENADAGLPFFCGQQTEETGNADIPFSYTYAIQGDYVTKSMTRTLEYTDHQDTKDPVTGSTTRVSIPTSWENIHRTTITPTSAEIHSTFSPVSSETILVDAADPHQIRIQLTNITEDATETLIFLANRHEDGQDVSLRLDTQSEYAPMPSIQLTGQWKNDILSHLSISFDTLVNDEWRHSFMLSSESAYIPSAGQLLTTEGREMIAPNRYGVYEDQGYQKELQQIGKSRLNLLVLTKLPKEARPLLTPLLAIITAMGQ